VLGALYLSVTKWPFPKSQVTHLDQRQCPNLSQGRTLLTAVGLRAKDVGAVRNEGSSARTEMPTPRQRRTRGPKRDRRRALELLDTAPDGCTEAIILAHGFKSEMLAELISAGLATARADPIVAGGRPLNVTRIRITDAGRRALAELRWP
jgi:hypothetical protein